jgi:cation transport protein ChaC
MEAIAMPVSLGTLETEPAGAANEDLWVFAYGSLMWRPGFEFVARSKATIQGWQRRLCIFSHFYRGTAERPGLVLGLDTGGQCTGVAFRVPFRYRESTIRYLRKRELVTAVYREEFVPARLESGVEVKALAYIAEQDHSQYAAPMDKSRLIEFVRQGIGQSGDNAEYVLNTQLHLEELGIVDAELEWLAGELRRA